MDFIAATTEHFQGISALVPTAEDLYRIFPNATFPLDKAQLTQLKAQRKELTVLMEGERVIAFANLYKVKENQSAFIGNVIVAKSHRGQGIGQAIILYMRDLCINKYAAQVHLSVFSFNTEALLLYTKLGFKPYSIERRINLSQKYDALIHLKLD